MASDTSTTCFAWSGGKDSFLAFELERQSNIMAQNRALFVTFVPQKGDFRCHPLGILQEQSKRLGFLHLFIAIDPGQWKQDYRNALTYLRDSYGVDVLVTGDIFASIPEMNEYWLARLLSNVGIKFRAPLLGRHWAEIMTLIVEFKITAVVSGMTPTFYERDMLGRQLDQGFLVKVFQNNESQLEFDMCGEQGEYHTTVTSLGGRRFCPLDLSNLNHIQLDSVWSLDLPESLRRLGAERIHVGN